MKNFWILVFGFGILVFPVAGDEVPSDLGERIYEYEAVIVSVYDGDTIRADIDLGFDVWIRNTSLRLLGLDAPEVRGQERPEGLISRDRLRALIPSGTEVLLRTSQDKKGKYGRWLAKVFVQGENGEWINVNAWLVREGLAEVASY